MVQGGGGCVPHLLIGRVQERNYGVTIIRVLETSDGARWEKLGAGAALRRG
jgi:hypothetical protein